MERKSFLFYRSYLEAVNKISDLKTKYNLLMGIINYGLDGDEPEFNDELSNMAWVFIEPLLDANYQNYLNGCKGGAPEGNQNAKKQPKNNRKTTTKQPKNNHKQGNDNVNDNDKDNVKDNVNVNANDNENVNVNVNKEICPFVDENGIITNWDKFQEWKANHPNWKGEDD